MTVIAAIAAVSPVSPAPAVGGKDVAEGFDAMLAVATAGEAPATPAVSGQGKAQAAEQSQAAAVSDEEAEQASAAGQTDAAALAAATLVAAMVPPTQQTFSAAPQAEANGVLADAATSVAQPNFAALPTAPSDDAILAAADLALDASAVAGAADLSPTQPVAAPADAAAPVELPVAAAAPLLAEPRPIADPKAVAPQAAPATAGHDLPPEAMLTTPVAAADLGLDAVAIAQAMGNQTAASQMTAAQANVVPAATMVASPTTMVAPVDAAAVDALPAPVMVTPIAEAPAPAPAIQAAVQAGVQAAAEPAIKLAMSTVPTAEAEVAPPADESPVKIAGVAVSSLANPSGGNASGANLGDSGPDGQGESAANNAADASAMIGAEVVETAEAPTLTPSSTSAAPLAAEAQALAPARPETRGSPETVAQLSAEILKKLEAQTTRFDVALTPDGLGTVDVRIEIGRNGDLTASMAFDTAQAAAELRSKSQELRQALSQAGFTVADNALRFDVSSQGGQHGQNGFFNFNGGEDGRRAWSGKAFQAAQTDDTPTLSISDLLPGLRMAPDSGLDIRI